eukprot:1712533-Pleurochrysis_carterae.AAC.1
MLAASSKRGWLTHSLKTCSSSPLDCTSPASRAPAASPHDASFAMHARIALSCLEGAVSRVRSTPRVRQPTTEAERLPTIVKAGRANADDFISMHTKARGRTPISEPCATTCSPPPKACQYRRSLFQHAPKFDLPRSSD